MAAIAPTRCAEMPDGAQVTSAAGLTTGSAPATTVRRRPYGTCQYGVGPYARYALWEWKPPPPCQQGVWQDPNSRPAPHVLPFLLPGVLA